MLVACAPKAPPSTTDEPQRCDGWSDPQLVSHLSAPDLTEASGLAASAIDPDRLYALNDSGNPPDLFALRFDGSLAAQWRIEDAKNVDWEDLARGPCAPGASDSCLFLGDIGDNAARRTELQVYVVREPALPPDGTTLPLVRRIRLRYPDGARDSETLLVHPRTGDLYLVGKRPPTAGDTSLRPVFVARADQLTSTDPVVLEQIGEVQPDPAADALITGGSIHPAGERLVLRTYGSILEYRLPAGQPFERIFASTPQPVASAGQGAGELEQQGEAITYDQTGRALLTTSEGSSPPLNRRTCEP